MQPLWRRRARAFLNWLEASGVAKLASGGFCITPWLSMAGLSEAAAARTAERVAGRDILAIQDSSEIILGGAKTRAKGYGSVGRGGALGGVLLHPVLAVDAATSELLGLADIAVWNRATGKASLPHARRALADKESQRWLTAAERAGEVLAEAARITVVADRESDIHEELARRPAACDAGLALWPSAHPAAR